MEILLIVTAVTALLGLVIGVVFLTLLWSTLTMHRQAMHSLHQRLERDRLADLRSRAEGVF